ncbi:MAG: alpha/beta hydrolase [Armatimonadetes bacterium]|nr:alpha/beta hydrolase [Armatimonadota bacterium]
MKHRKLLPLFALCGLTLGCVLWKSNAAPTTAIPEKPVPWPGEAHVYKTVAGRDLRLWVVRPASWKGRDKRPGAVFFHGGGWIGGVPGQFAKHAEHFAARGMVCVLVEYRLLKPNDGQTPTFPIQDAKSAMRWVRGRAADLGIDPNRIAAGGGSAGGHLAAFASMAEGLDDPQDDQSISPRGDAMLLWNPVLDNGPKGWSHGRVGARFREFSPAHNISGDDPPAIVMLGTQDNLIPVATIEKFKAEMEKAGVRCDAIFYPDQKHAFFNYNAQKPNPYFEQTLMAADEFLVSLGWLPKLPKAAESIQGRE